jgi:hypothetical protein
VTLREILERALDQGLLTEPRPDYSTLVLVDQDGCVVSVPVLNEFLDDPEERPLATALTRVLLRERARVRGASLAAANT